MKKLAETHHLQKRGAAWYYRRRVPTHLRRNFGVFIQKSLGTTSKKTAIKNREILDVEWSKKFDEAEAALNGAATQTEQPTPNEGRVLTEAEAIERVRDYVEKTDARCRKDALAADPFDSQERDDWLKELELELAIARDRAPQYDHHAYVHSCWKEAFRDAEAAIDEPTFPAAAVFDLVKRAGIELQRRSLARAHDDHSRAFFDRLFDPSQRPAVTIWELAEQYLELKREEGEAHKLGAKSIDKKAENLALVREILGDDTLVRDINWDACRSFLRVLTDVPSNRTKIYKGISLQDAIARAKTDGRPRLAAITQGQYLTALKDLLDLAVNKELIRTNYAKDLRPLVVDDRAPDEKRISFEIAQLVTFFNSAYYRSCANDPEAPYRRADKSWRFWFPVLSLFSGMRPKEIFQMHVQDLRQTEKGTWYFDIVATSDDDDEQAPQLKKTTKTKTSRRQIPVHPELQKLGFLGFVDDQRKAQDDPLLFRGITRGPYNDPAHYPLRDFRESFLPQAIDLKPRQSAYSFRHTWRDAARGINASPEFLKAVGAWSSGKSTADIYGTKHQPDLYAKDVARISYEGLNLSHLYPKPMSV
jgi:hypothetical protein